MTLEWTARFQRAYRRLDGSQQGRVDTALGRLAANPRHPSLRVKKLQGIAGVWEARASDELRITFELIDRGVRLRTVGHHDATLRSP